jgi:hypothetical protein
MTAMVTSLCSLDRMVDQTKWANGCTGIGGDDELDRADDEPSLGWNTKGAKSGYAQVPVTGSGIVRMRAPTITQTISGPGDANLGPA